MVGSAARASTTLVPMLPVAPVTTTLIAGLPSRPAGRCSRSSRDRGRRRRPLTLTELSAEEVQEAVRVGTCGHPRDPVEALLVVRSGRWHVNSCLRVAVYVWPRDPRQH